MCETGTQGVKYRDVGDVGMFVIIAKSEVHVICLLCENVLFMVLHKVPSSRTTVATL